MKNVLCISDSSDDVANFVKNARVFFFQIMQLEPEEHSLPFFQNVFAKLEQSVDLSKVDLVIAEYIEAIPLVYFMRKKGHFCPVIFIPHTNPYPLNILIYFLLVSIHSHPDDLILCGSEQAANGYMKLVNIKALPICTFGIKNFYKKGSKEFARSQLGFPQDKKILLYTGRFMNDKGISQLLSSYEEIKKKEGNVSLILSITHIDPDYFNSLASRMGDVILFYRLEHEKMILLYQSADLFVSTATSIFETYGKSPLEAIACGVPVVLPNWDGFSYYINNNNGSLAKVNYCEWMEDAPYSFATVDIEDFANKCCEWINKLDYCIDDILPKWAYYDETMTTLSQLVQSLLLSQSKFYQKPELKKMIDFSKYLPVIKKICIHYKLVNPIDLEEKAELLGLINREEHGDPVLLRELHHQLFGLMDATDAKISMKSLVSVE